MSININSLKYGDDKANTENQQEKTDEYDRFVIFWNPCLTLRVSTALIIL